MSIEVRRTSWYRSLWHKDSGLLAKVLCFLGLHDWRSYVEDTETCGRCLKFRDERRQG